MSDAVTLPLSDLKPDEPKRVTLGDEAVCVVRCKDGSIYAVRDECSHASIPLSDGPVEGRQIVCPWHGAMFDLKTGRATCGPAVDPIRCFAVTCEGETVRIER